MTNDFKSGNFNYCEQAWLLDGTLLVRVSKTGGKSKTLRVSKESEDDLETLDNELPLEELKKNMDKKIREKKDDKSSS